MPPSIYLDHNATTPIAPEVLAAMLPWLREGFGNPASDPLAGRRRCCRWVRGAGHPCRSRSRPAPGHAAGVGHARQQRGNAPADRRAGDVVKARGALSHRDAAQSAGEIPVDVDALGVDLLTLAGHTLYAPKGIGVLYQRAGTPLAPILFGLARRGPWPGTENIPYAGALGAAAMLVRGRLPALGERLTRQRDRLHAEGGAARCRGRSWPQSRAASPRFRHALTVTRCPRRAGRCRRSRARCSRGGRAGWNRSPL